LKSALAGIGAVAFDAYGTLFDVHAPFNRLAAAIGPQAQALSELWRRKQLEYTWLRSLMRSHAAFDRVTEDALDYALASRGIHDAELRARLLGLYRKLDPHADAEAALAAVKARGLATAILSNGSPGMLADAVSASGLGPYLDHVISIEEAGVYKPAPEAYSLAEARFGLPAREIGFVSANGWDAVGAAHHGLRVVHVNRAGLPPERLGPSPAATVRGLDEFAALLG
jgi:2-haloacid dehalogenase